MSTADLPGEPLEVLRDGAGWLYADADPLPELSRVLDHARGLEGLVVADTDSRPSRWTGGEWILTFTYQGHRFGIHTEYHAQVSRYSSPDADCPEPLFREVVAHFEGIWLLSPIWVPPPLAGRRLLLLVLIALAVAVVTVTFLSRALGATCAKCCWSAWRAETTRCDPGPAIAPASATSTSVVSVNPPLVTPSPPAPLQMAAIPAIRPDPLPARFLHLGNRPGKTDFTELTGFRGQNILNHVEIKSH